MQLTQHQKKTLELLAGGLTLKSTRVFPFPHVYGLYSAENPGVAVKDVGEATVRGLVNKGLIVPRPRDKTLWDTVVFELTPLGHENAA